MKKDIILIGGGGHCKVCIDIIEAEGKFKIAGIVDIKERQSQQVSGYKIRGSDEDLPELVRKYQYFLLTIGQIKSADARVEKFEQLKKLGAEFPAIISPLASVSKSSKIEEGTIVMHGAIISPDTQIGKNCIVNTGVIIEHDSVIGDHCHISTGSIVNGGCRIGSRTFIGSNAVIVNNIRIGDDTLIGAGAVVVRSISKKGTYAGNPVKELE